MGMEPTGARARWARMAWQRDEQFDHDVQAMMDAYQRAHPSPVDALADAVMAVHKRPQAKPRSAPALASAHRDARRGFFPDGTPVPAEFKRRAFANYQALRDAFYRGEVAQQDLPRLMNSAEPDGPSELVRHIFGV